MQFYLYHAQGKLDMQITKPLDHTHATISTKPNILYPTECTIISISTPEITKPGVTTDSATICETISNQIPTHNLNYSESQIYADSSSNYATIPY